MFMEAVRMASRRRAAAGGGSSFTPADLTLTGWWDPSDLSTMFQNSAGTTPVVSDGDPVARINDKSGNSRHLFGSSGQQPLYKTSGWLYWLDFNGISDVMGTSELFSSFTTGLIAYECFVGGRFISVATNATAFYSNDMILTNRCGYIGYP